MQLDVGNEPYLSKQKPHGYQYNIFSIGSMSGELAKDYCYDKEWYSSPLKMSSMIATIIYMFT